MKWPVGERDKPEYAMHTITTHVYLRFIEVKLEGLCSMAEFQAFTVELRGE